MNAKLTLAVALAAVATMSGALVHVAGAQPAARRMPPPPVLPAAGDAMQWPTLRTWLLEPSPNDASGKVIIHWFCSAKPQACKDDLARIITLREGGHAYVIAYIDAGQRDAQKLDPIRGSEGVGFGGTAYGPEVTKLMKAYGIGGGPASIVVGLDGKVAQVFTGGTPDQLDARDAKVNALAAAAKDFTTTNDGPKTAAPNQKFPLTVTVNLASYLTYSQKSPSSYTITGPSDIRCDSRTLNGDQLKIDGHTMTATVTCSVPTKGVYEVRGQIRFAYDSPAGATGIGDDGATWKFEVK